MTTTAMTRLATAPVYAVLPAEDLERARGFYEDVLGLSVDTTIGPGAFLASAGGGTKIMVYERARTVAEHTVAGFQVDDLDATMTELRGRGVIFEEYDLPGLRTENGIADMDGSRSAWLTDTEGNIIALSERG